MRKMDFNNTYDAGIRIGVIMSLVSLNLEPTEKQLKHFGLISLIMLNLIGLGIFWLGKISGYGYLIFATAGILTYVLGKISQKLIKPIFLAMIILTFPIGWTISHLVMALFYYGIITGIGLFFRVIKRDPLYRKYDSNAGTYWIPSKNERSAKDYFRQF